MENNEQTSHQPEVSSGGAPRRVWFGSIVLFFVVLVIFIFSGWVISSVIGDSRESEFRAETERLTDSIRDRFELYTNALRGGKGLFDASVSVEREEWQAYVKSLQVQQQFPGIQGFGYSEWIDPADLEAHIERVRAEGFPEYRVHPEGERSAYTAIVYLEPFDLRNREAFGFDMFQEKTRNEAMGRARDLGGAALSGKVTLVQEIDEDVQAGFLVYVPVYEKGVPLITVEDRRSALLGFVYSPFRMKDFIQGAVPFGSSLLNVEVFDEGDLGVFAEERRMYGTSPAFDSGLVHAETFTFGGHTWVLRYAAPAGYKLDPLRKFMPVSVGLAGGLFALLLAFVWNILRGRQSVAVKIAESMTKDLKDSTRENEEIRKRMEAVNVELKEKTKVLSENMKELTEMNKHMVGRELKMKALKTRLKKRTDATELDNESG